MPYNEVLDGNRQSLNELVESLLSESRAPDPTLEFTRAEARALVLRAIEITRALHPESRDALTGSQPKDRALRQEAVRIAVIELERGYRGPG